jgi:hypothetical protein
MRVESGEKIIDTGIEPSAIDWPAGSSTTPVGNGRGAGREQPSRISSARHETRRMRAS